MISRLFFQNANEGEDLVNPTFSQIPMATSTPSKLSSGENGNGSSEKNSTESKKIKLKNMNSLLKEEFVNPENNYYQSEDIKGNTSNMSNPLAMEGENNESEYLDDDQSNDVSFDFTMILQQIFRYLYFE